MKRIIEIAIITTILFGLAFCFGCKDKAEADTTKSVSVGLVIDPNSCIEFADDDANKALFTLGYTVEPNEPKEGECTWSFEGSVYGNEDEPEMIVHPYVAAGGTIEIIEPNEPEHVWKCSCGQGWDEMLEIFCGCGKTYKTLDIIMKCIPTWPDYIELEKELIVIWPKEILEDGYDYQPKITMSKGAKIYFKD